MSDVTLIRIVLAFACGAVAVTASMLALELYHEALAGVRKWRVRKELDLVDVIDGGEPRWR